MRKLILLCLFLSIASFASPIFAADGPGEGMGGGDASRAGADESLAKAVGAPLEPKSGNVTVDFKDADINNVLRIISYKSGVNIVTSKDVSGTVTIRLVDVPWERALDVILRTHGFAYEREGNIIRVTTLAGLESEELASDVFILNYAKAESVKESVKSLLSDRGRLEFDARTNRLIITDIPTNLYRIRQVVERLDAKTPQVSIEARIVETTLADNEKLGIDWQFQAQAIGASRPTTFPFQDGARYDSAFFPRANTGSVQSTSQTSGGGQVSTTVQEFGFAQGFPFASKSSFTFGTLNFTQLQAVLDMLKRRSDTNIKSNPRIVTLNNQQAEIVVGQVIYIPTFERNETTGRFEISGYEERDTGIKLTVTPHVNDVGDIVIDLKPEITTFVGLQAFSPEVSAPIIATRGVVTQVRVRDGETIAIGGLIKENDVDVKKKVPILGDIPLLGLAFTRTEKTKEKTDLLFFLTVNIVKDAVAEASPQ